MSSSGGDPSSARRLAEEARLWEHGIHEDNMLSQRGNLFLLAQPFLVVAFTTILLLVRQPSSREPTGCACDRVLRLPAHSFWFYLGHRHFGYSPGVQRLAEERLPDYALVQSAVRLRGLSSMPLIVYGLHRWPASCGFFSC